MNNNVSPYLSKLAKEKGFTDFKSKSLNGEYDICTHEDIARWLRENHDIYIYVYPRYSASYETLLYNFEIRKVSLVSSDKKVFKFKDWYEEYEEALDNVLIASLEILL